MVYTFNLLLEMFEMFPQALSLVTFRRLLLPRPHKLATPAACHFPELVLLGLGQCILKTCHLFLHPLQRRICPCLRFSYHILYRLHILLSLS
jgi:hypothetical protein